MAISRNEWKGPGMILAIGFGNTLRRDDGAGPYLARRIGERCGKDSVRVIVAHQLVPEMVDDIVSPDVTAVLFMDAGIATSGMEADIAAGREIPGSVGLRKIEAAVSSPSFGHHLDPSTLLTYAHHLYGCHPEAWLISIPGVDFGFGEGLSEVAHRSLEIAEESVLFLLNNLHSKLK